MTTREREPGLIKPLVGVLTLAVGFLGYQLYQDFPRAQAVTPPDSNNEIATPSPEHVQNGMADLSHFPPGVLRWEGLLRQTASDQGVSVIDLATIMTIESGGVMTIPGGEGEQCAMQIMFDFHGKRIPEKYPKTPESLLIPEVCIWVAADIIADYQAAYPQNPAIWFAAYNGGPEAARWFNGEISEADYVAWINSHGRDGLRKAEVVKNYVSLAMGWRNQ